MQKKILKDKDIRPVPMRRLLRIELRYLTVASYIVSLIIAILILFDGLKWTIITGLILQATLVTVTFAVSMKNIRLFFPQE